MFKWTNLSRGVLKAVRKGYRSEFYPAVIDLLVWTGSYLAGRLGVGIYLSGRLDG